MNNIPVDSRAKLLLDKRINQTNTTEFKKISKRILKCQTEIDIVNFSKQITSPNGRTCIPAYLEGGRKNENWKHQQIFALDFDCGKPQAALSTVTPITPSITPPKLNMGGLWERYTEYKSSQVAASTLVRDYSKIAKRLRCIPESVEDAVAVRDWLMSKYSSEVARRTLNQLNACFSWAVKSGLASENRFEGMASDIKKTVRNSSRAPFSAAERDAIIEAFENNIFSSKFACCIPFLLCSLCPVPVLNRV